MNTPAEEGANQQERAVLREWEYLQESLFTFVLNNSSVPTNPSRPLIKDLITNTSRGCAQLWWAPYTNAHVAKTSRLLEVRYQHFQYGMLELAAGYLVSSIQPHILHHFAQLCALIIALTEHEAFVQHQIVELIPLLTNGTTRPLSGREQDILRGFMKGKSEAEMAQQLGVEKATIHSHIQGLYHRLQVHNSREAIVRIFELRLMDWLDFRNEKE
ncbi:MAG TPA: LuxR C-terminal-related transcriptional regulator [Ktedonobacteraceae bacterium]|nr:LuxR C-terminal-related transcriptional regulator [Ktedonobacteraceae bacterium]